MKNQNTKIEFCLFSMNTGCIVDWLPICVLFGGIYSLFTFRCYFSDWTFSSWASELHTKLQEKAAALILQVDSSQQFKQQRLHPRPFVSFTISYSSGNFAVQEL